MSTPLFIRTPSVGNGAVSILGASLAAYSGATAMVDITDIGDEATLVEEVLWCTRGFSSQAGMLILGLVDGSAHRRLVGAYAIPVGTSTLFSSGRIALNLTIEPGYKLVAAHNVKDSGAAFTDLELTPIGGIVR